MKSETEITPLKIDSRIHYLIGLLTVFKAENREDAEAQARAFFPLCEKLERARPNN